MSARGRIHASTSGEGATAKAVLWKSVWLGLGCLCVAGLLGAWVEYQAIHAWLEIAWLEEPEMERVLFALSFLVSAGLLVASMRVVFQAGRRLRFRGLRASESGTVVAEFALVLPIVIMLFGTLIQLCLLANTAMMLRYAAFNAARSAMVSFESDTSLGLSTNVGQSATVLNQFPPVPELVDLHRPTLAAALVMAGVSPRPSDAQVAPVLLEELSSGFADLNVVAQQMDSFLARNSEGRWQAGGFAPRVHYAWKALTVESISDSIFDFGGMVDSYSPLTPKPKHAIQPAQQEQSGVENAYTLTAPPPVESLIPDTVHVPFIIPVPSDVKLVLSLAGFDDVLKQKVDLPLDMLKQPAKDAGVFDKIDGGIDFLRTGSGSAIQAYAESGANVDPMSPKEVEVTLTYKARLAVPSLFHLLDVMPAFGHLVEPAPVVSGKALNMDFNDYFTVRLQSTGGRRAPWGMIPFWFDFDVSKLKPEEGKQKEAPFELVWNLPLYWIPRESEKPGGRKANEAPSKQRCPVLVSGCRLVPRRMSEPGQVHPGPSPRGATELGSAASRNPVRRGEPGLRPGGRGWRPEGDRELTDTRR